MSESFGEALRTLNKLGGFDAVSANMEANEPSEHHVKHRFSTEIIIPLIALTNNITFIMSKGEKYLIFADGIRAKVVSWEEKHICELDELIQKKYNCGAWEFLNKWFKVYKSMDSCHFLHIILKKEE